MRNIFKKGVSVITSLAVAVTLMVGVSVPTTVSAAEKSVALGTWSFYQCADMLLNDCGEGRYNSITTTAGETVSASVLGASGEQTIKTTKSADGVTLGIAANGWDAVWAADICNPWQVTAAQTGIKIEAGHIYTVSFKVKASSGKYGYFAPTGYAANGSAVDGGLVTESGDAFIVIGTEEKTVTYELYNEGNCATMDLGVMLGAFNGSKDYAGTDRTADMVYGKEATWAGTVYITDFKVVDITSSRQSTVTYKSQGKVVSTKTVATGGTATSYAAKRKGYTLKGYTLNGKSYDFSTPVTEDITLVAVWKKTAKPKKTSLTVKSTKKKKAVVTIKRVKNAKGYRVQYSTNSKFKKAKTKNSSKAKVTLKKLKSGSILYVRVKAYNKDSAGNKVLAKKWSKKKVVLVK